jgi:hypothetical protein
LSISGSIDLVIRAYANMTQKVDFAADAEWSPKILIQVFEGFTYAIL